MAKNRITTYTALLMGIAMASGAVLSVGEAQARPTVGITVQNTALRPGAGTLSSDCLVPQGNQTVLLGRLSAGERTGAAFTLTAAQPMSCQLLWQTDGPVGVQVELEGVGPLEENNLLYLDGETAQAVRLTVTAPESIPVAGTAEVLLSCGGLSARFRVELEADPPQSLDLEEPEDPEQTEDDSVTVIPPQISMNMAKVELNTLPVFGIGTPLPVEVTVSGYADTLRIGLEDDGMLLPMTRYSTDGGQSWYMLYEEAYIELPLGIEGDEEVRQLLLVELPREELWKYASVTLEAVALLSGETADLATADAELREEPERSDTVRVLRSPSPEEQLAISTGEPIPNPEDPGTGVTEGASFRVPLPVGWSDATQSRYTVEFLGIRPDGTVGYLPVEWDPQGLNAAVDYTTGELAVTLGQTPPPAGTYRLTLECHFEELCFHREQMTFFINYSTRSDVQEEEVPNNE